MAFIPLYDGNPLRHIRRPYVAWGLIVANVLVYFIFEHGGDQVAWWSHVGGLITGAVLVLFLRRRGVRLFDREELIAPALPAPPKIDEDGPRGYGPPPSGPWSS